VSVSESTGRTIALIPARGGSKGISLKNLSKVGGTSLLTRTIRTAFESRVFDEIWVSSDNSEFLRVAETEGALTHLRSSEASGDGATASDVIFNFNSTRNLRKTDTLVYLQPTSPFRDANHIREAFDLFNKNNLRTVISVKEVEEHPEKMFRLDSSGTLVHYLNETNATENRQTLGKYFYPNGAIYIFCFQSFLEAGAFPTRDSTPYYMNKLDSVDIDSEDDLIIARMIEEFKK
jgi:CMP-N-acetylneuraminic acid synthetase